MTDFDPERADGVTSPANGIDRFLVLKASGELEDATDARKASGFTAEERRRYAADGVAMPDGSFPIPDKKHLKAAIRMIGLTNKPKGAVRRHIIARAKALGLSDLIPSDWSKKMSKAAKAAPITDAVPTTGDGRGSLDSVDFYARVNEALAALQTSIDQLKSPDMLGGGPADPEPDVAKAVAAIAKAVEAHQADIDRERQDDSTGEAGAEKANTRDKKGRWVSNKKFKRYQKAEKAYREKAKVDADQSVKGKRRKAYKSAMPSGNVPRSTSFGADAPSGDATPAELVRKSLAEKNLTPQARAAMAQNATAEMLSTFGATLGLFPAWNGKKAS